MITLTKERDHYVIADYDDADDKEFARVVLSEYDLRKIFHSIEDYLFYE